MDQQTIGESCRLKGNCENRYIISKVSFSLHSRGSTRGRSLQKKAKNTSPNCCCGRDFFMVAVVFFVSFFGTRNTILSFPPE